MTEMPFTEHKIVYTQQAVKQFTEQFSELLAPYNRKGTALIRFLERNLAQRKVYQLSARDVLMEGFLRGRQRIIVTGEAIRVPEAWLRRTGLYIINEHVRHNINQENVCQVCISESTVEDHSLQGIEFHDAVDKLKLALERLSREDRIILILRSRGMSYKQIQDYYQQHRKEEIQQSTLRKREARAIPRLREIFRELYRDV